MSKSTLFNLQLTTAYVFSLFAKVISVLMIILQTMPVNLHLAGWPPPPNKKNNNGTLVVFESFQGGIYLKGEQSDFFLQKFRN